MNRRTLGKTGYQVSEVGLGCWQLGGDFGEVSDEQAEAILTAAWENGIDFWDTADVYGAGMSESRIGRWCAEHCDAVGNERPTIVTKVGRSGQLYPDKYTRAGVRQSLEQSLERIGGETLDLAQLHCVPFEVLKEGEIFAWLDDLKQAELIRHYGASVETIEEGLFCLQQPGIASLQIIFNIFRQDAIEQLLPAAQAANVGIIVRLPLASGLLAGKFTASHQFVEADHRHYNRDGQHFNVGETFSGLPFSKGVELVEQMRELLPSDVPLAQLALRWILDQPAVSAVIAGVTRPAQAVDNAAAARLEPLSVELHRRLQEFYGSAVRPLVRGAI